jgi:F-type H+-transporting ATPase subunit a
VVSNILALGVIGGKLATGLAVSMIFIGIPLALGISMLEILVCFIQAYVFTMLSIIFVGAAVHPEH